MNSFITRLFAHIPGGVNVDMQTTPSLVLSGTGSVTLAGDILYAVSGSTGASIDLHGQTVQQIASAFPSGITAVVQQSGMADLLSLPDDATNASVPVTLSIPTNPLWYVIGMMARMLESLRRSLQTQAAQIDLQAAATRLLDWWGASLGVGRYGGEPDTLYAQRMTALRARPVANNVALEQFLTSLGYGASVIDSAYGELTATLTVPSSAPSGYIYTLSQLQDMLDQAKAAGVLAIVFAQATLQDSTASTDSLSYTLNDAAWTVGNVNVGEFNV